MSGASQGVVVLDAASRRSVWQANGASEAQAAELLAYASSPVHAGEPPLRRHPFPDPPCTSAWERYVERARSEGVFAVLRRALVQLRFPIQAGISQSAAYQLATRRGVLTEEDGDGLRLLRPEGLRMFLHATPAGRVPVVVAEAREDFEALVQAVTRRNEPVAVPPSMGASMIAGYNNWDRVAELRLGWQAQHPEDRDGQGWAAAFGELQPRKELYQDRFMLVSSGPYSSTPASALALAEAAWRDTSMRLRVEHECTHFFMREAFGAMRSSLLDELVADYMGLVEACGVFRADWFLRFMGLESYPRYREGGRFENYRGTPPLTDGALAVLQRVVVRVTQALGRIDSSRGEGRFDLVRKAEMITALTRVGLEGLASDDAPGLLAEALVDAAESRRRAVRGVGVEAWSGSE